MLDVFRTRVRPGRMADYMTAHRRIPDALASSLTECGVIEWAIWSDNETDLIHFVTSADGLARVEQRMTADGRKMPEWDALISTIVDRDFGNEQLSFVWGLSGGTQS